MTTGFIEQLWPDTPADDKEPKENEKEGPFKTNLKGDWTNLLSITLRADQPELVQPVEPVATAWGAILDPHRPSLFGRDVLLFN